LDYIIHGVIFVGILIAFFSVCVIWKVALGRLGTLGFGMCHFIFEMLVL